ncbi:MAG: putative baseplate assembly protein [Candidatus Korobacteraceae bacterium]
MSSGNNSNATTAANCCATTPSAPAVPQVISNPPGLPAIRYRIGTFTSFRQAMLDAIAVADLMASTVTQLTSTLAPASPPSPASPPGGTAPNPTITVLDYGGFPIAPNFRIKIGSEYLQVIDGAGTAAWTVVRGDPAASHAIGDTVTLSPPNPFANWHPLPPGQYQTVDYQTMFVELWAYLADILTFYQERIANEAYVGTASLRESLLRLVRLIDYHPAPGAGASGLVAFSAANGSALTVPAGFRVASKPAPGQPPVVFETSAAVAVTGENSSIPLSQLSPDVPFYPLSIVLKGTNAQLATDDFVLAVENEGTDDEEVHVLQLTSVNANKTTNTTMITWDHELGGGDYQQPSKDVSLYALRVTAVPFGANAPEWATLSPTLTDATVNSNAPYNGKDWDAPTIEEDRFISDGFVKDAAMVSVGGGVGLATDGFDYYRLLLPNAWFYIPVPDDPTNVLFLDAVYKQLIYTQQNQGWAVLLTADPPVAGSTDSSDGIFQVLHVVDGRQSAKVGYTLSSKITRLTFTENLLSNSFPLRNTMVLTGGELLPVQVDLPLPPFVYGSQLILQGVHNDLQPGQTIVITGTLFSGTAAASAGSAASESVVLDGAPMPDTNNNITVLTLKSALTNTYNLAGCAVLANIAVVTQGETVKDEVLGSSDGSAFQSYALKKQPLTYLPSTDAEGLAAVTSTLTVTVNGIAWNEQPDLVQSAPSDQDFTTTEDDSGQTTVVFGDGFNGARPASGSNNIHARYRKGLGSSGNLQPSSIQQLVDSVPNLQKVSNPVPSSGGSDADAPSQIRVAAPASLRTFGRAVSAPDYAALARSFPGIAKATAAWVLSDPVTGQAVAHPYIQLAVATVDDTPIQGTLLSTNLRRFLDSHRDPNVLLRLQDFSPIYLEVAVEIDINSRFPQQATISKVQAALNPGLNPDGSAGYFAPQQLQFGQSIFLSALYATVQSIPGVQDVTITSLRRVGPGAAEAPGTVHDIVAGPTQLAVIGQGMGQGQLTVTGSGGFLDT